MQLSPFVKLSDHTSYVACDWDLAADADGRRYWVDLFKRHFDTVLELGVSAAVLRGQESGAAAARAQSCRDEFHREFNAFAASPRDFGRVTILTLDQWRDRLLQRFGFIDAFADVKNRENEQMLPLLPRVCRQLDALTDPAHQLRAAIEGVFAGNIFDLGAEETTRRFLGQTVDFFAVRSQLAPRPWLIDDYDALADRLLGQGYRKCVFFIDNAGSDFLLGVLPLTRWLAQRGTHVVLAANERPSLNDMTIHDIRSWWGRVIKAEPGLNDLPIECVSTGTGEPLIDLLGVSDELNQAAADADLLIIEGMGRGVESNLHACFTCDALNIAMLKDSSIAQHVGGKVYDLVLRFRTGE